MKTRVAFGVVGAIVVVLALFVFPPIVAQVLMMALSVAAAQEFTAAIAGKQNKSLQLAAMLLALGMSWASARDSYNPYWTRGMLYIGIVVLFIILTATSWLMKYLGNTSIYIIRKFFGIIVLAIACQLIFGNFALVLHNVIFQG